LKAARIALVCGGREFKDNAFAFQFLDAQQLIFTFTHVLHGNCRGADTIADAWALARGIQPLRAPALSHYFERWEAGPIRNEAMAMIKPYRLIAFPGHTGTASMLRIAEKYGIEIIRATPR